MDTHRNSSLQIPSPPLNSISSSNPNDSHLQTLPSFPSDFDNFSPLSTETTPDYDTPDPAFPPENEPEEELPENEENEALDIFPRRGFSPCSVYRWGEPWAKRGGGGEVAPLEESHMPVFEPKMSSADCTDWVRSSSELECRPPAEDYLSEVIEIDEPDKPFVSDFLSENKPPLVGAGIANLGNTCFLNSILQCFIHTVPLLQGLLSCDHRVPCECNSETFCVICALCELIEHSLVSTERVVSPWKFVDNLNYFSSCFQRFQQEDAHEFLQCFLDRLESRCDDAKPKYSVSPQRDDLVKNVFGGRLVSKLQCCNCGHCSDTYEPSIDLSLEIEDAESLLSALESFTKVEKIEDSETKFTCEKCKEKVYVEKQLLLDQAPNVAVFHLKRFKTDGSFVEKIDKYVQFPRELDLLPYTGRTEADNAELKYDLFAVVVHIGFSSTSGHYYCFIRSSPDTWYKFDDSKVVRVQEEYVLSQEAYILFYAKQGTPWFSSFIESQKPFLDPTILNTSPKSVLDSVDIYSSSSVLNNYDCDVNETSEAAKEAVTENLYGPLENKVERSEAIDDLSMKPAPVAVVGCNSSRVPSHKDDRVISPSVLKENNHNTEFGAGKKVANITPTTPPRSPSPEIYKEDPPDTTYSIPRGHVRMVDHVSCKRQLNKDLEDMGRKQACSLIKKNIPGPRGQQLMAAMMGSRSEGSTDKKRSRRMETSSSVDRNSTARRKSNNGPGSRILAASVLR